MTEWGIKKYKMDCKHVNSGVNQICSHVFKWTTPHDGVRRFTGEGVKAEYLCKSCASQSAYSQKQVCDECVKQLEEQHYWSLSGHPAIKYSPQPFRFDQRQLQSGLFNEDPVAAYHGFHNSTEEALIFTRGARLFQLNIVNREYRLIGDYSKLELYTQGLVTIKLCKNNTLATICCRSGEMHSPILNRGLVVDLSNGEQLMPLEQGDYHTELTEFPVAFIENKGRTLLVHATDWNKLDVTDPITKECLTQRDNEHSPCADIEDSVFTEWNGTLKVSPDQSRIATIGWVWHPFGVAYSWRLDEWLNSNVWEADCGPSKVSYATWDYFWDSPFEWLDNTRLVIWGYDLLHTEQDIPLDSVAVYDAESEVLLHWFVGPTIDCFFYDEYLFSGCDKENTLGVWDVESGELLHSEPGLLPFAYQQGSRELVCLNDDGSLAFYGWSKE